MNASTVKQEVKNITDELISIRRYLHQNPELSFQEIKTSKYISELLNKWGIEHTSNVGGYGIIGILKGKNPDSKVIALRADMDALPIIEENNVKYCSVNDGVMHACGHDVHMTCLLGTIKLLSENRDWFNGSIKFIFQPAEETLPGGALKMIEDGVLENPKPDLIIGQHVFPELESGKVGVRSGPYMASTDELNLTISGRGGHGALPQTFDDTIHTAAELIHKIKEKVNEKAPTDYPTVLSFGKIVADGAYNIIPKEVIIKGTFRTFDENWRKIVHKIIKTIATEISAKHNTNCDVFINSGYPVLENDKQLAILFEKNAIEYLGEQNVEILDMRTTGEDFARFTQLIPGVFYRLGIANKKQGINSRLHSPTFNIDESSIEIGTGIMIWNTIMTSLDDSY
ncbi:MAG: amidohydrolase [Lentimicrobiaceae bacterium]|mgnify:FL=1|jgi:amidohydrolase|nr:amidohydrolase [Lentimicrobiaceae bacterium]MCP4909500.1 amidohydrolase [Bacteroidota bacterium]MBT4191319.1 amidohydrolase [Lentimicrobiaceae bacterium]MBT6016806.1 amidohydrolase [Lentimicrobiaceae bacterium]MBT6673317.1 amidohydrolase [Lentimicrobiaceae bacterium]